MHVNCLYIDVYSTTHLMRYQVKWKIIRPSQPKSYRIKCETSYARRITPKKSRKSASPKFRQFPENRMTRRAAGST